MQKCRAEYACFLAYSARHLNYLLHFIFFQHLLQRIFPLDAGKMEHPRPLEQRLHVLAGAHARAPRILRQGVLALADLERVAGVALSEGTAGAGRGRTGVGA